MYKVYIKVNEHNQIITINSDAFIPETELPDWTQIDEGEGDKYHHAQNNYLSGPLVDNNGEYAWQYVDGKVQDNSFVDLDARKKRKLAEMATARYVEETVGITVSGAEIKTDRESQSLITGAALQATQNSDYTTPWKCSNGFVTLTAAQILAIAQAVRAHVEAAFAKEATVDAQIEVATTEAELDAIVWPES